MLTHHFQHQGKYMNRLLSALALTVLAISFSPFSFAAQNSVVLRCDGCTDTQKKTIATQWGYPNFTLAEAQAKVKKLTHITDFTNNTITTYELSLNVFFERPNQPPVAVLALTPIATPADINYKFQDVVTAVRSMKSSVENSIIIPSTVIKNSWEFVNCAYCESHLQIYLNQQIAGKIETGTRTIEALSLSLGLLNTPIPNTYKIPLQAGGYIYVEIKLTGNFDLYIKALEAVDIDGNKVPFSSSSLQGTRVFIGRPASSIDINNYINPYNVGVPSNRTGSVIILTCGDLSEEDRIKLCRN